MMEVVQRSRFRVAPYQYYARTGSGHTPSRGNAEYWTDCDVPWVTTADVKHLRDGRTRVLNDTEHQISRLGLANSAARLHPAGTVVLSRTASVGFSAIMEVPMATSQDFVTWSPGGELDSRFLLWVLRAMKGAGDLDSLMYGSTHKTIYVPDLQRLRGPLPSLDMQRRIADYLGSETARIDTLIAKNEHAAALTEERQVASAEQRLGVFPRVPMWMVVELLPGYAYSSSIFKLSGDVRLLRGINVTPGQVRWDDTMYADGADVQGSSAYSLVAGDIVFGMDRPWIASGVRAAMVSPEDEAEGPIRLVQRVLRIRVPRESLHPELLLAWMRTRAFYASFEPDMTGVSVPHVSAGQVGAVGVPVPPREQQGELVRELGALEHSASAALERLGAQRDLLRERRQALITAAVTGEIEV